MEEVCIRVLGRTSNDIGDQLEGLTKQLLARLGFGSFTRNAYETGAEIDLQASHRVTSTPVLCECKAHTDPIGSKPVRYFYSQIEKKRKVDPELVGLMFSTSGFTGTAEAWYNELVSSDSEVTKYFQLRPGQAIIQMLVEREMCLEPASIRELVRQRFPTYAQGDCWLTHSVHGLAWIVLLLVDGIPRFHMVLNEKGRPLPTWVCREIADLCGDSLAGTRLLGLEVRHSVIVALFNEEGLSADSISFEIEESAEDVGLALEKLASEGLICVEEEDGNGFRFVRDVVPFVRLAREFLEEADVLAFLRSSYTQEMLQSEMLLSYVDQRYQLGMSANMKRDLGRIISMSPSALREALFGDTQMYRRTRRQILERIQEDRPEWEEEHAHSLIRDLMPHLISDLEGRRVSLSGHLGDLGIKRYRLKIRLDMAGPIGRYLSVEETSVHGIETISEPVKAGSLVSYTNPAEWHYWNGILFLDTEDLERAHYEFDKAIRFCREGDVDSKLHQAILTNKGVAHMRQEQWSEAINCFDAALGLSEIHFPPTLDNKALCLDKKGMHKEARELLLKAEQQFPELGESRFHQEVREQICEQGNLS